MNTVRERERAARPHLLRAAFWALAAAVGLVAASVWKGEDREGILQNLGDDLELRHAAAIAAWALFLVAGIVTVRTLMKAAAGAVEERLGDRWGAPLGFVVQALGYLIVVLPALGLLGVNLAGLLVGGAITGVAIGIAAQQTLANFFAGVVLLLVRPFAVGDHVVLRSGPLGGEYEGTVTEIGFFYVDLETERGPVALPNAGVLAAAVGPGARSASPTPQEEEAP